MVDVTQFQTVVEDYGSPRASIWSVPYRAVGIVVGVVDFVLIVATCVFAAVAYHHFFLSQGVIRPYLGLGAVCGAIFVLLSRPLYSTDALTSFIEQLRGLSLNWTIVLFDNLSNIISPKGGG